MLKQYGTAILRHLIRQRSFTVVIVAGLTIGITASLVLVLYIQDELRYDRFFPDAERMYRITFEGKIKNTTVDAAKVGFPIGESIKKNFKEVEDYCRLASWNSFPVRFENMASTEAYLLLADPQFFSFFNIQLVEGNPAEALRGKHKLVLSQSAAKRIFNYNSPQDASPIGKVLQLAQGYEATVTGIAEDMPSHSHFHFSMILSLESWEQADRSAWISQEVYTYVKFLPIVNEQETIPLILKFTQQQLQEEVKKYKATFSSLASRGNYIQYKFQPLTAIHLHSSLPDEIEAEGDIRQIILFACIATFILVLACINFVNLSTARATSRAKEVGIRKVLGAENKTIVFHFLLESYVYTGLALLFALVLVAAAIVPMNVLTDKRITIEAFGQPVFIGTILLFLIFTGLFSGGYPAFFLARLSLVDILKGYLTKGITTYTIRNFLVSFQFGVSIALLIACWIMANQIVLLKQKETRLPDAHCLRLYHTANIGSADSLFKQQVLTLPGVKSFAYVNQSPPAINWSSVYRKNNEPQELILYTLFAEASIKDVLNLSLVTGRFLTSQDTTQIVINQSAARKLNIHDLSTRQYLTGVDSSAIEYEIVGIVSDFHFQPLHKAIEPLLIHPKTNPSWEAIIRFSDSVNFTQMDAQLSETWKRFSGHVPYQSFYMKDQFRNAFEEEEKASWVLGVFSFLALLIATLGLIGLLTYAIEHKAKEMGVRMVVGADKMQLLILFLKDFSWQVLKAFCIAAPLTWLSMQYWVNTFPYKVPFPFFIFLSVGVGALLIVWLTVAIRVLPFLTKNPALLLRDE